MRRWELFDGEREIGPVDEADVLQQIAEGLPATTMIRRVGRDEWRSLRTHAPFAAALEKASGEARRLEDAEEVPPPAPAVPVDPPVSRRTIVLAILGALVLAVVVGMTTPAKSNRPSAQPLPPPSPPEPVQRETPAKAKLLDELMTKTTMVEALAVASPYMVEAFDETSPGAALFALWSLKNLRWSDVGTLGDETSFAKIQKNVDAERRKRLCVPGTIVEIAATKQSLGTLHVGLMLSEAGNLFHFIAVRSTGELVKESAARFCGIVTGKFDYKNSAGGVGHAVELVGMFDLRENITAR